MYSEDRALWGEVQVGRNAMGKTERKSNKALEDCRINRDGLTAGTPAPNFRLPAVNARELSLDDYRGGRILLVFSNPDCEPCSQLLPELERLHRSSQDLQIHMVSEGMPRPTTPRHLSLGLHSRWLCNVSGRSPRSTESSPHLLAI
jgi:hypothetical protein